MSRSLLLLALLVAGSSALRLSAPAGRLGRPVAQARDEDAASTTGKGFGPPRQSTDAETLSRGQKALEELRAQAGAPPVPKKEPEMYIPTRQEKDTIVYGFAGFLILGGFISLFLGGSLWEATESAPAAESASLFGYAPSRPEAEQP